MFHPPKHTHELTLESPLALAPGAQGTKRRGLFFLVNQGRGRAGHHRRAQEGRGGSSGGVGGGGHHGGQDARVGGGGDRGGTAGFLHSPGQGKPGRAMVRYSSASVRAVSRLETSRYPQLAWQSCVFSGVVSPLGWGQSAVSVRKKHRNYSPRGHRLPTRPGAGLQTLPWF